LLRFARNDGLARIRATRWLAMTLWRAFARAVGSQRWFQTPTRQRNLSSPQNNKAGHRRRC
jgi:hypothetical protein